MKKKVTVAIAGLGARGRETYAKTARLFPEEMQIVAIADPIAERVRAVAEEYQVKPEFCFESAEEMLEQERLADVMFICTQDRQHAGHAIPALKKGYHLLLEKPISPSLEECREIAQTARECGRQVVVCHVLRYTPFYQKIKEIIASGEIGDVVAIQATENVAYWHQAHSFVRGNWRNSELSSPMILQKSCHDMDILLWLAGKPCTKVSSFGSLTHFTGKNAPAGSTERCVQDCRVKADCPYNAERFYLTEGVQAGKSDWPINVLALQPTEASIRAALETGPYGRCVYRCDNNVVDHQVVNLELEDHSTISFTMCAFTSKSQRYLKVMGTNGDIEADMNTNLIELDVFGKRHEVIDVKTLSDDFSGHGGGDNRMIRDLIDLVRDEGHKARALTSIDQSAESHYVALAAERSRLHGGQSIDLREFAASR